jgi:hypothetical protein
LLINPFGKSKKKKRKGKGKKGKKWLITLY